MNLWLRRFLRKPAHSDTGYEPPEPKLDTVAWLADCRQGDHLPGVRALVITSEQGLPVSAPTPEGVILVSQTCDIVQRDRYTVHASPLIRLSGTRAAEARDGRRPRYLFVPEIGDDAFADLEIVGTIAKDALNGQQQVHGVLEDADIRRLALAIGRKFNRFAFPDNVVPWLRPLEDVARSKNHRPNSPEGRAFGKVLQLRIESANGWSIEPHDLVLAIIVQPGELPTFVDDELPDVPDVLRWTISRPEDVSHSSAQIADMLDKTADPVERYFLWVALGDSWASRCRPKEQTTEVAQAVASVRAEVVAADEYTLSRVLRSEVLDLDHLSVPTPLGECRSTE